MKAIAFTLDALFALIIATAAISILLYFQFSPETPYILKAGEAQSILTLLISTNTSAIAGSSSIISAMVAQQGAANQGWSQVQGQATRMGVQGSGPTEPFISGVTPLSSAVESGIVAGYGNIYFETANTLYAFNESGYKVWSVPLTSFETTPVLYDGKIIYWNAENLIAASAYNGSAVWENSAFAGSTPTSPMIVYNGGLITSTSSRTTYSVYQNNGTVASTTTLSATNGFAESEAVAGGSLALGTSGDQVILLTNMNNVATQGEIWGISTGTVPVSVVGSGNVIAFGNTLAVEERINGSDLITALNTGGTVTGVAASGTGTIVYQSTGDVLALASNGVTEWSYETPSDYGAAASGSNPVIGGGIVYSLWGNNYVMAQNLSTGTVVWSTKIPYAGVNPNMTLAYGRLYVTAGSNVIAYGSCNVNAGGSILQTVSTLYVNGQGSCADYILNSIEPLSNYSLVSGNTFLPGVNLADLAGSSSSYVVTGGGYPALGTVSISFWIDPTGSTGSSQYILDSSPEGAWKVAISASNDLEFSPASTNAFIVTTTPVTYGSWQLVTLTVEDSFANTLYAAYLNGAKIGSLAGTVHTSNIQGVNNLTLSYPANPYNGMIANLQIYDSFLNGSQIGLLYQGGVQGGPVSNAGLLSWYPLDGDANDYGSYANAAYPVNVAFTNANYIPPGLVGAYEIGSTSTAIPILNYTTKTKTLYSIGVDSWK